MSGPSDLKVIIGLIERLDARVARIEARLAPTSDGFDVDALSSVAAAVGENRFTALELTKIGDVSQLLDDAAGGVSTPKISRWLVRMKGARTSGGAELTQAGRDSRGHVYRFEKVTE